MKKILLLLLFTVISICVISCTEVNKEVVVIRYAAQNLVQPESVEMQLVQHYNDTHRWVQIEAIDGSGNLSEKLTNWASSEEGLPDIFFADNIPTFHKNGWLMDVKTLASKDREYQNVAADIRNAASIGSGVYAVPTGIFYAGYFIDRTIFEERNVDAPGYGVTFSNLLSAANDVANINLSITDGSGVAGIWLGDDAPLWMMAQFDNNGFYTYNKTTNTVNLVAPYVNEIITTYRGLRDETSFVLDALNKNGGTYDDSARINIFGTTNIVGGAKTAIFWDWTWAVSGIYNETLNPSHPRFGHDIDFIGLPKYGDVLRDQTTIDFFAIASTCAHPQEAWDFLKFMSFGKEGYNYRLSRALTDPSFIPNFPPLQADEATLNKYYALFPTFTEYKKMMAQQQLFYNEGLGKVVPGWVEARWTGSFGLIDGASVSVGDVVWRSIFGDYVFADYAVELNARVNSILAAAKAAMEASMP